jgi:hypothetical protein
MGPDQNGKKTKVVFKAHRNREELKVLVEGVEAAQAQLTTAFLTLIRRVEQCRFCSSRSSSKIL